MPIGVTETEPFNYYYYYLLMNIPPRGTECNKIWWPGTRALDRYRQCGLPHPWRGPQPAIHVSHRVILRWVRRLHAAGCRLGQLMLYRCEPLCRSAVHRTVADSATETLDKQSPGVLRHQSPHAKYMPRWCSLFRAILVPIRAHRHLRRASSSVRARNYFTFSPSVPGHSCRHGSDQHHMP